MAWGTMAWGLGDRHGGEGGWRNDGWQLGDNRNVGGSGGGSTRDVNGHWVRWLGEDGDNVSGIVDWMTRLVGTSIGVGQCISSRDAWTNVGIRCDDLGRDVAHRAVGNIRGARRDSVHSCGRGSAGRRRVHR